MQPRCSSVLARRGRGRLPGAAEVFDATNLVIRAEAYGIHRERLRPAPELFGEDVRRLLLGEPVTGA